MLLETKISGALKPSSSLLLGVDTYSVILLYGDGSWVYLPAIWTNPLGGGIYNIGLIGVWTIGRWYTGEIDEEV